MLMDSGAAARREALDESARMLRARHAIEIALLAEEVKVRRGAATWHCVWLETGDCAARAPVNDLHDPRIFQHAVEGAVLDSAAHSVAQACEVRGDSSAERAHSDALVAAAEAARREAEAEAEATRQMQGAVAEAERRAAVEAAEATARQCEEATVALLQAAEERGHEQAREAAERALAAARLEMNDVLHAMREEDASAAAAQIASAVDAIKRESALALADAARQHRALREQLQQVPVTFRTGFSDDTFRAAGAETGRRNRMPEAGGGGTSSATVGGDSHQLATTVSWNELD